MDPLITDRTILTDEDGHKFLVRVTLAEPSELYGAQVEVTLYALADSGGEQLAGYEKQTVDDSPEEIDDVARDLMMKLSDWWWGDDRRKKVEEEAYDDWCRERDWERSRI